MRFTGRFCLQVALAAARQSSALQRQRHPVPPDELWAQIRRNLNRRMGAPTLVRFSSALLGGGGGGGSGGVGGGLRGDVWGSAGFGSDADSVSPRGDGRGGAVGGATADAEQQRREREEAEARDESEVVAFTCGHSFASADLRRSVLPDAIARIRRRVPSVPHADPSADSFRVARGGAHGAAEAGGPTMSLTAAMLAEEYRMYRIAVRPAPLRRSGYPSCALRRQEPPESESALGSDGLDLTLPAGGVPELRRRGAVGDGANTASDVEQQQGHLGQVDSRRRGCRGGGGQWQAAMILAHH